MSRAPVQVKNVDRLSRTIPRAIAHPSRTEIIKPSRAPTIAWGADPADSTIDHSRSAVSIPSRATETKPTMTMPHSDPWASARSSSPSRVFLRLRAARCIQKIIQVTSATAAKDRSPPMSSWPWVVRA